MNAPWESRTVADRVPAHVAAAALDPNLAFTLGWFEIARNLSEHGAVGDLVQRLAQDSRRLVHLADANHVAVHRIAQLAPLPGADRNIKVKFRIDRVRDVPANIEPKAATAQVRTNQVIVDRIFKADYTDVGQTLNVDFIVRDQRVVLFQNRIEVVQIGGCFFTEARW